MRLTADVIARPAPAQDTADRLRRLASELEAQGVEAELCLVGGAVIVLSFAADPSTRRITALFRPSRTVREAADRVAVDMGLPPDWMNEAARAWVPSGGLSAAFFEEPGLRVFSARGDYVFAMKCAALGFEADPDEMKRSEADLRYLLRYLDIHRVEDALRLLSDYLPRRYLPEDLEERLEGLLGH